MLFTEVTWEGLITAQNSLRETLDMFTEFPQEGSASLSLAQQVERAF